MDTTQIMCEDYLTENEDMDDNNNNTNSVANYHNLYKFLSTQTQSNIKLKKYFWEIGFFELQDCWLLDEEYIYI